ncbi:hypothetical protein DSL72_005361 [Monilinia vaccinii-corymbosi]|uniref:Chitin-binding type-2 domain-containing protein n=1 Tax=Monilinia vaccinii-corymbosi TaxID=61207 RepID=A0A8A3PFF0_9HELO|nr:hypothetical protein DSL72_005361 [Monilinia vaccinii-corymbosi]
MMGLTRSTLVVLFSFLLLLQPLANAQDQAQGRPGASAPAAAPAPAAGRPGAAPPVDQVPVQPSAPAPAPAPAAGRPGAQAPVDSSTPPAAGDPAQPRPKVYSCPADNGARYTTANGVTFELKCDHGTIALPLDNIATNSQKDCADYCSTLPK